MERRLLLPLLCFALTVLDILVVELYFRPLQAWSAIWIWHRIYLALAYGVPALLAWRLRSLVPLATWLYFIFGIEDTCFYALQGYLPERYWGVPILGVWEPPLSLGLKINFLGLALIILFLWRRGAIERLFHRGLQS